MSSEISTIIYLNGATSSGKSTLAYALQDAFSEPYLRLGIDSIIDLMPAKLNDWSGKKVPLGFCWNATEDAFGHLMFELEVGPFAKKMVETFREIAKLLISFKYNLIIDDVSFGFKEVNKWLEVFQDAQTLYVGVKAPLEVLEKREKFREDRLSGTARAQFYSVHENIVYDLEIDTHARSLEENVQVIQTALSEKYKK